jgi:meiotically up-regulated gene 157 (Mug157) protein
VKTSTTSFLLTRRSLLQQSALATGAFVVRDAFAGMALAADVDFKELHRRPDIAERRFTSALVDAAIVRVQGLIKDAKLAQIFANCLPNTLDTTVFDGSFEGKPDTFVITGDIDAMWLRDSAAQVWPYLEFCKDDTRLATMVEGVIRRQARCVLLDPYANAFLRSAKDKPLSWSVHDETMMKPGVGERKWEIDSLCYVVRLAHGFWKATGSVAAFDAQWKEAATLIVKTFREQQRKRGAGPYHFQRKALNPTDTLPMSGYGNPAVPVGMIFSGFRPSDDACVYPLFVPANLFAITSLKKIAEIAASVYHDAALANDATALAAEVSAAVVKYGMVESQEHGRIWAFEVDGYGNSLMIDDANAPGLLSMAYLECVDTKSVAYQRTRAFALSASNPFFFSGTAAEGVGSPHTGVDTIWPMGIMQRAFSSHSDEEVHRCLKWLRDTTAGTNFMHECFHKDDPTNYTRPWFAWANTLFGELILKVAKERPAVLRSDFA